MNKFLSKQFLKLKSKILTPISRKIIETDKINSRNLIYSNIINSNSVVVELGVWRGVNAKLIYSHNPKYLYLIDIWSPQDDEIYKLDKGSSTGKSLHNSPALTEKILPLLSLTLTKPRGLSTLTQVKTAPP